MEGQKYASIPFWYFSDSVFGLQIEPLWPALAIAAVIMVAVSALDHNCGQDYEQFAQRRNEALAHWEESNVKE